LKEPLVIVRRQKQIVTLTLNNPKQRNALNLPLVDALERAIKGLKADPEIRAVILTGSGPTFSSWGDVNIMSVYPEGENQDIAERLKRFYRKILSILDLPAYTIAAINGHAFGAGCALALFCDMRIASSKAKLGLGSINIGLHPGMGTTYFLPRQIGLAKAYELLVTGRSISALEAAKISMVNRAVKKEKVMDEAFALAERIADGPIVPLRRLKVILKQSFEQNLNKIMDLEVRAQVECFQTEDLKEGIAAFLERREPQFKGK
jgi:enoyl-CoA hydratase/carnithine racemase